MDFSLFLLVRLYVFPILAREYNKSHTIVFEPSNLVYSEAIILFNTILTHMVIF